MRNVVLTVSLLFAAVLFAGGVVYVVGETVEHFTAPHQIPYCPPNPEECD